jgi:tetratricopeptide (TPR) repeat protein
MPNEPRYRKGDKIAGRYLVHEARAGGVGELYLCLDLRENLPFALKTLQPRYLTTPKVREFFEYEAATWVKLEKHPNVVRCFYLDKLDTIPFLFLEWVPGTEGVGTDLADWLIRRGPFEPRRALEFTLDVCRALDHARRKVAGFVHCDVKPQNVLVAQGQLAKLTDFGLAKLVRDTGPVPLEQSASAAGGHPQVSSAPGTPSYMAPEQWRGGAVDARTDVYAVGCLLYALLSGQSPFRAVTREETMARHLKEVPAALEAVLIGLPGTGLDALVARCLAKEPESRYPSSSELFAAISRLYETWYGQPPRGAPDAEEFTALDYSNRGATYQNLGRHGEALADFEAAIRIDPNLALAYSNRGVIYETLCRHAEALADYDAAIRLDPNDAGAYFKRGNAHHLLRQHPEALVNFDAAIRIDPNLAPAYNNRGVTFQSLGRHPEALADFDAAIRIDPDYALAYYSRGCTYADLGRHAEALVDYDNVIRIDPCDVGAHCNRGVILAQLGRHAEALADCDAALRIDPHQARTHFIRGSTYVQLGRHAEALEDFSAAIRIDPNFALAYYSRGCTYETLGRHALALADYDAAIRIDPNFAPAYDSRGCAYETLGRHAEALADYNAAIRLDPSDAGAYYSRGRMYNVLARYTDALADFDAAIRIDPDLAQAYSDRGATYDALGRNSEALADYDRAIRINLERP